jgi:hypothetical protein
MISTFRTGGRFRELFGRRYLLEIRSSSPQIITGRNNGKQQDK